MSCEKLVFVGIIASSKSLKDLQISSGFLAVDHGRIVKKGTKEQFTKLVGDFSDYKIIELTHSQFLMPGLVDCHTHAPQFPNLGLGLDRPLLEWLDKYTFPLEIQYGDVKFAAEVYDHVVQRLLRNGTTTACYFGSIHLEGTMELVKSVMKHHQRALIGKVSMNVKNNAGYYNATDKELADVEEFVTKVLNLKNDLVWPVVTPRFALSCDEELMTGLSKISHKYGCMMQSHISENVNEVEHVLKTYPDCKCYGEVYDKSQILNNRCIMAHAVHLTEGEMDLLAERGVSVAHCPASNTRLRSGLCPVRKLIDSNITVGLGTDVSGGDSPSILEAMRRTMDVSTHLELQGHHASAIDWREAFYLATLGGAKALGMDNKIGSFEVGKEFDALLVDLYATGGPVDRYSHDIVPKGEPSAEYGTSVVQRFAYLGDDRNILRVYVKGEQCRLDDGRHKSFL